jgi:hypothetical protein
MATKLNTATEPIKKAAAASTNAANDAAASKKVAVGAAQAGPAAPKVKAAAAATADDADYPPDAYADMPPGALMSFVEKAGGNVDARLSKVEQVVWGVFIGFTSSYKCNDRLKKTKIEKGVGADSFSAW